MRDRDVEDPGLAGVGELLRRERPTLTFDERDRLDGRLEAYRASRRQRRRGPRLRVVICLAFGLLFMMAGTGLAISGLATPGAAVRAQYPDAGRAVPRPPTGGATGTSRPLVGKSALPSRLGSSGQRGPTPTPVYVSIRQAEARGDLPFTGFNAVPILVAGILFIVAGGALSRGTRRSSRETS